MEYKTLPTKYRPQSLSEFCGQEHITVSIRNFFKRQQIPNVFLFTGQYGSGKTTTARLITAMLNCEKGVTLEPCGECMYCKKVQNGSSIDIQEIDAATHRGIDKIRALKESARYGASEMRHKVIILDECHQLTEEANNSLLKLLEEPPSDMYIFLCTTEPRKVLPTIHSRCQRYDFKKLLPVEIYAHIKKICDLEKLIYSEEALRIISKISNGSMRDALRNVEALRNFCDSKLDEKSCNKLFGVPDAMFSFDMFEKILTKKTTEGMMLINQSEEVGTDINLMIKDISQHLRDILVLKTCKTDSLVHAFGGTMEKLKDQATRVNILGLLKVMKVFEDAMSITVFNLQPRHVLEKAFIESIITYYQEEKSQKKAAESGSK
jgi:DNA polymerase-3 subunit gamma/tau